MKNIFTVLLDCGVCNELAIETVKKIKQKEMSLVHRLYRKSSTCLSKIKKEEDAEKELNDLVEICLEIIL